MDRVRPAKVGFPVVFEVFCSRKHDSLEQCTRIRCRARDNCFAFCHLRCSCKASVGSWLPGRRCSRLRRAVFNVDIGLDRRLFCKGGGRLGVASAWVIVIRVIYDFLCSDVVRSASHGLVFAQSSARVARGYCVALICRVQGCRLLRGTLLRRGRPLSRFLAHAEETAGVQKIIRSVILTCCSLS